MNLVRHRGHADPSRAGAVPTRPPARRDDLGLRVVRLVPEYALLDAAEHALQIENFRRDQVLELRLRNPRR